MMDEKDLKTHLECLIRKYIRDEGLAEELILDVKNKGSSVAKGVLHQIEISNRHVDEDDGGIIKEIYFYIC